MDFLTESDIKHAALRFLKSHYKYRPRIGDTQARLDNITKSGIIADGFLSFQTDINQKFEATFEATSYAKAHEVKYKVKKIRLLWDSMMVGFILTTIIFAILYNGGYIVIGAERVAAALLFIMVGIFFFTMFYRLVCQSFSSYRQIYALEQFKLYDADEQWVAVGEDVFENPEDKYLKELKRQCVLYGFGLMIVDKDWDIRQSITPSQVPLDGRKRNEETFEALAGADNNVVPASTDGLSDKIKNYTDSFATSLGWEKERRFRYDFRIQLLMIILCSVILSLMIWKEAQKTKEDTVDRSGYKEKMRRKTADLERESDFYLIEEDEVVQFEDEVNEYDMEALKYYDEDEVAKWYDKYHQDSLFDLLNNTHRQSKEEILDSLNKILAKDSFKAEKPKAVPSPIIKKPRGLSPICREYANWYGVRYVLQDGVYNSRKVAEQRIGQINKASAMAGILRGGCFKETKPYYIVYVDVIYTDKDKATAWLSFFDKLLKDKGYSSGDLQLVAVSVKR